ncbi:hypothetical protein VKT23_014654 [Stygiomarasmius scandens]|uniref:Uncharacterized protein n=1 Tax=Marasmiellus scandens TaxID=2682957 RepID=A0ABR1J4K0_9AGAR
MSPGCMQETATPLTPVTPRIGRKRSNLDDSTSPSDTKKKPRQNESPANSMSPSPSRAGTPQNVSIAAKLAAYNIAPPPNRTSSTQTSTNPVTLPLICEVTNAALQDEFLKAEGIYSTPLPALRAGTLVSWSSSAVRKGNIQFTEWVSLGEDIDFAYLMKPFKFTRHGQFINLARIDSRDLTAYRPPSNAVHRVLYTRDNHEPAICLFPIYVEASYIKSFAATNTLPPKRFHKIDGLLHSHDADRATAVITMLLGEGSSRVGADVYGDVVTWSTRFERENDNSQYQNRVYSSSTSGNSSTSNALGSYSLPFDANIPVYDARPVNDVTPAFNFFEDLPTIDTVLRRYDSEIPTGSLAVVASTVTSTTNTKIAGVNVKVNLNLRFIILLGIPSTTVTV